MKENIIVKVFPRHFKNSPDYCSNYKCPLALALKEKFPNDEIVVSVGYAKINNIWYEIMSDDWHATYVIPKMGKAKQGKRIVSDTLTLKYYETK